MQIAVEVPASTTSSLYLSQLLSNHAFPRYLPHLLYTPQLSFPWCEQTSFTRILPVLCLMPYQEIQSVSSFTHFIWEEHVSGSTHTIHLNHKPCLQTIMTKLKPNNAWVLNVSYDHHIKSGTCYLCFCGNYGKLKVAPRMQFVSKDLGSDIIDILFC